MTMTTSGPRYVEGDVFYKTLWTPEALDALFATHAEGEE